MNSIPPRTRVLDLTARIVSAHVAHNAVAPDALSGLIVSVYNTLMAIGSEEPPPQRPEPAVPIKRSVFPDYIICLEEGKKLKTLKRHLKAADDLTPDEYRQRWGLRDDYPMVAPSFTRLRSALAKTVGLGRPAQEREKRRYPGRGSGCRFRQAAASFLTVNCAAPQHPPGLQAQSCYVLNRHAPGPAFRLLPSGTMERTK